MKRDPRCPSAQERAEHELTHLPFRIWCKACVEGRLENRPHPLVQRHHDVPTVLMDYAFVSKADEPRSTTILVMKDRESRTIMADVVLHKGRGEEETIQQAAENVRRLGYSGKIVIKIDNEPALIVPRSEVAKRLDNQVVCESPPAEESPSNGCMENGAKLLKGVLRIIS